MNTLALVTLKVWNYLLQQPVGGGNGGDDFWSKLAGVLNNFKTNMGTIVGPIAILCIGFCAIKIIIADNKQEVSQAKSWIIGIVIGLILFYFAGDFVGIFTTLAG